MTTEPVRLRGGGVVGDWYDSLFFNASSHQRPYFNKTSANILLRTVLKPSAFLNAARDSATAAARWILDQGGHIQDFERRLIQICRGKNGESGISNWFLWRIGHRFLRNSKA
jgi:hypothetical protein